MKNGVIEIEKSKRQLAGAVLFALSAVLMVAGEVASFLWLRSLSVNDYFSTGLSNLLQNMPSTLIRLLVPVLFFLTCLFLYHSKPRKNAVSLISIATTAYIIQIIINSVQSFSQNANTDIDLRFVQQIYTIITNLASVIPFILLVLTVFGVLKTKIPMLIFSAAISIISLLEVAYFLVDKSFYSSHPNLCFETFQIFVFWVAMYILVSTFPKRKPKKETTVSAEIIEPAADMLAVQPETAPVQPDADA